jgi:HD-like signal output (HDOD) protein
MPLPCARTAALPGCSSSAATERATADEARYRISDERRMPPLATTAEGVQMAQADQDHGD